MTVMTISKEEIFRGILQTQVALVLLTCDVLPLSVANVMKHICMEVQQLHAMSCKCPINQLDHQAGQLEAFM